MKVYDIVYKEGETEGIYALGMVYDPAMQDSFVALNKEEIKLSILEEKRMVFGAVLIPNKEIPRIDGEGNTFALRFSEDTIEQLGHDWISKGSHVNFSEQHEKKIEGLAAVEMWTVKDPNNDTSNFYGKTYPKGTLVALSKINNDDTWAKIKSGEINGYSIEAILGLQEFNFKQESEMTEEVKKSIVTEVLDGVKALFSTNKVDEPKNDEVVAETTATETEEVVEEASFDVDAFKKEMQDLLGVEFKKMLEVELSKKDEVIETKSKEIETLQAELNKQPEAEETVVTPVETKLQTNKNNKNLVEFLNNNL